MKSLIAAVALLVLATSAFAAEERLTAAGRTVTLAQWKDIHTLYKANFSCLDYSPDNLKPENWAYKIPETENQRYKKACDLSVKMQTRLGKQGFCITSLHHPVGREGRHWTQEKWKQETGDKRTLASYTKGGRTIYCYPLHKPS